MTDKLGYYTVGEQRFDSKIDACIAGTKLNIHPQWHFNDHVWNNIDWTIEPEIDILELYKMRARQIREQYDYLIVYYSGGSDCQTLVDAFLKAGCFIDEIVTIWNRKHTKKIVLEPGVTDATNIEAEFDLTTRTGLERIRNASPLTKITYSDVSDTTVELYTELDGEEWLQSTVEHLNPHYIARWSTTRTKHQQKTLDRGLRTAAVFGVDKPKVCIKDGKYCLYFVDVITNSFRGSWNRNQYTNIDNVYFFWTPDLPEIVVKQAHMIMTWFEQHPMLKPILAWPNLDYSKRNAYEIITRSVIYPEWDLNTFQCVKTSGSVYSEWDNWFFEQYQGTKIHDCWRMGIDYVEKHIDKKYLSYKFDGRLNGFVGMINGHFLLEK
jgi:hypothetical protein